MTNVPKKDASPRNTAARLYHERAHFGDVTRLVLLNSERYFFRTVGVEFLLVCRDLLSCQLVCHLVGFDQHENRLSCRVVE